MDWRDVTTRAWQLVPTGVRRLPLDLLAVVVFAVSALVVVGTPLNESDVLTFCFGFPLLLFVPGYAIVAAMFPATPSTDSRATNTVYPTIGIEERIAISIGISLGVTFGVGVALTLSPWRIRPVPLVLVQFGICIAAVGAAMSRRNSIPEEERFQPPIPDVQSADSANDKRWLHSGILAVSTLVAITAMFAVFVAPSPDMGHTELYLLHETEDGEYVADEYPRNLSIGRSAEYTLGIDHGQGTTQEYTVVVSNERWALVNGSWTLQERERLRSVKISVPPEEPRHRDVEVNPTLSGGNVRITFELYENSSSIRANSPHRTVFVSASVDRTSDADPASRS